MLMRIGVLSAQDYENWRFGRVPYLEKVCKTNLSKLSFMMRELSTYARQNHLRPSWTAYNQWGVKGRKIRLRFSKSGDSSIEEGYATHYVAKTKRDTKDDCCKGKSEDNWNDRIHAPKQYINGWTIMFATASKTPPATKCVCRDLGSLSSSDIGASQSCWPGVVRYLLQRWLYGRKWHVASRGNG